MHEASKIDNCAMTVFGGNKNVFGIWQFSSSKRTNVVNEKSHDCVIAIYLITLIWDNINY